MKRIFALLFAVTITTLVLVMMPIQKAQATAIDCDGNNNSGARIKLDRGRQREELFAAYAQSQKRQSIQTALNQQHGETTQRSAVAIGLSLLALLVGLVALARLSVRLLSQMLGWPVSPARASRWPLWRSLTLAMMVTLVSLPLLPEAATWLSPTGRPSVAPARVAATSSLMAQTAKFTDVLEIGGTGTAQIGGSFIDQSGNIYVTGGFEGNMAFQNETPTTLNSTQDNDLYIAKYDATGTFLWARAAQGATGLTAGLALEGALAVVADSQGNVYIGGGFVKSLTFKDRSNNPIITLIDTSSPSNKLNFEPFVAKYDPDGTLLWAKGGMSGSPQEANDILIGINGITDIVVDNAGNPYVVGTFAGTNFLGQSVSVAGKSDVVVSRLNPATGAPVWISVVGTSVNDGGQSLGIDAAGNVYVLGEMGGDVNAATQMTFPTQPSATILINPEGHADSFVAKYTPNGQCLWAKQLGGSQFIFGSHVAVNGAGQIYVTGIFNDAVTFGTTTLIDTEPDTVLDGSALSGFLAKLDTDGQTWLWARGFSAEGMRVSLDGAGNPFVTGNFYNQAMFGTEHQPASQTLSSMGEEDQFIAKYDAAGNFQFVKALSGDGKGSVNFIIGINLVPIRLVTNSITGATHAYGDFIGKLMMDGIMLDSGTDRHVFVARLDEEVAATATGAPTTVTLPSATFTFSNVTKSGDTILNPLDPKAQGAPPPGFTIGDQAFYIDTSAAFSGPVQICFNVPSVTDPNAFSRLSVLHRENGVLVDRTTSKNFATKTVCASVDSFSPFVLAQGPQQNTPPPLPLTVRAGGQGPGIGLGDPAVCLDPGGLVGNEATLTNPNAGAPQAASFTATLPAGLTAVAGSCSTALNPPGGNLGTCTIATNGSSVTWNGALAAGQIVTLIYRTRIGMNVTQGTQFCIDNMGTVGNVVAPLQFCFSVNCPLLNTRVSDQKAGSVLVFPYYTSTIGGSSDTRMTISNISNAASTVANQAYVHLFFIDGTTCQQSDLFLCLTPNASFSFKASDFDPGNTGYLLAVAVNNQGAPIQNNVLMGNAFVNTPDFADNYSAESFAANSFAVATVDGNMASLYFDHVGYDAVPKQFAVEIQSPLNATGQQVVTAGLSGSLVNSTLSGAVQVGAGLVYNGNEKPFGSFNNWLTGACQAKGTIVTNSPRVPNGMAVLIPAGQVGTLKFTIGAGVGLLLTPRTATWKGIRTLHKTQSVATILTIPILVPVC